MVATIITSAAALATAAANAIARTAVAAFLVG